MGPAGLQLLTNGVSAILQIADLPEAIIIGLFGPAIRGVVDCNGPAEERLPGAVIYLVAGEAVQIVIGIGDDGVGPGICVDH